MKLVLFGEDFRLGILKNDNVIDASSIVDGRINTSHPQDMMKHLIENFDTFREDLQSISDKSTGVPRGHVRLRAPLPNPARLVCMAVNYLEDPSNPVAAPTNAFNKSSSSIIGHGDTVVLPDIDATIIEHEAELGLVIGKKASKIDPKDAYAYIFGYVNFIDVSCRGVGPAGRDSFFIAKSWDTFGPMGPAIVTADEIKDPLDLSVRLSVGDQLRQDYNTNGMANKIPELLEWITCITTLEAGDVVACGTNHLGLGPLQDGDTVNMEIGEFGNLTVKVVDEQKRQWPRETRAQKEARDSNAKA